MMRKVFAALLFCVFAVGSALAADFNGKWTSTFSTQIGEQTYTYEFHVDGTKMTGKAVSTNGSSDITDGQIEGDTITFTENLNMDGNAIVIAYKGTLVGDEIKFTRDVGGFATEALVAKRVKE
ncbi:MAG: hypothetical protein ABI197_09685 [Granulicella sp.]